MLKSNLYFSYKYSLRFLLIQKLNNVINTYSVPSVNKLTLFFSITKVDDVDHVQGYNYAYLFRFFFGKRAFLTRQRSFFNLGKWKYSYNVSIILRDQSVYEHLFLIINDILPKVDKSYLSSGIFAKEAKIYYLVIRDMNVFSEKKTNLGLFFLENNLNFHIFCNSLDLSGATLLLRALKLSFFK